MLQVTPKNRLAKLRRQAKRRGFRVLRDGTGAFSVIATKIEPPRALVGLEHAPLWAVEQAMFAPLPEPPPRRKRVVRLVEPTNTAASAEAGHSFRSLIETLKAAGGAS
jgi:hypothetical protein